MSKLTKALTAAAGNAGGDNLYVEDVFSTYLYQGNSTSPPVITNSIDLADSGGMVWIKARTGATNHTITDTERGAGKEIYTDQTWDEQNYTGTYGINSFNSDGFSLIGANAPTNTSAYTYASWTFRKAEKFFDVVTYTGTGSVQNIAHNLGSVPACIIIKKTSSGGDYWNVYHSSLGNTKAIFLNDASEPVSTSSVWWNNTTPTDSVFTVGTAGGLNASGSTMVAYLFASDAGGFGDDGDESIIKCGSYTGNNSSAGPTIDLGFEPQWVLIKQSSAAGENWVVADNMRGVATGGNDAYLFPNTSNSESSTGARDFIEFNATGFTLKNNYGFTNASATYIYIAIRRPMKTPESGTEVFAMNTPASATIPTWNSGFVTDFAWYKNVDAVYGNYWYSRLTGGSELQANSSGAEITSANAVWDFMDGFGQWSNGSGVESWMFKRATGFFDVVAYTGNGSGSGQVINHNLGVTPEIIIIKGRSNSGREWHTYVSSQGQDKALFINSSGAEQANTALVGGTINSTQYELKVDFGNVNGSGETYISYLFATVAGVSKVGSYTGTGSNVDVDCGFSAGARFILIKRTDSTGDWYVYDSERGIVAGNDPYFFLNSTAAQVTNTDYIDPLSSGFTVTSSAPAALNASGGTYIFLAIA